MSLNNRLKGTYYNSKLAKLASRSEIMSVLRELKTYHETLIELLNTTYTRITNERAVMIGKLNLIYNKILHIEYILSKFNDEIDIEIMDKLQDMMNNFDTEFIQFIQKEDANVYNHNLLEGIKTGITPIRQNILEYNRSVHHVGSDLGFRWFGGKISNSKIRNELNNCIRLLKINNVDGNKVEDYNISNPIIELFIFGPKGMSWLEIGQNGSFGYNIIIKYQSKKNTSSIELKSETYSNKKEYEVNNIDLDMILNFTFGPNDGNNNDLFVKIKTNIPSNSFSGLNQLYITGAKTMNNFNDTKFTNIHDNRMLNHNNRDVKYYKNKYETTEELTAKQKTPIETDQIVNGVSKKIVGDNVIGDENFSFNSKINISLSSDTTLSITEIVQKNNDIGTEFHGVSAIQNGITLDRTMNSKHHDSDYFNEDNDDFYNKPYNGINPLYIDGKQPIDLTDYRNIGSPKLIAKNENMFSLDNSQVINTFDRYEDVEKISTLDNDLMNNEYADILTNTSFYEKKPVLLDSTSIPKINYITKTTRGTIITTEAGVYTWNNDGLKFKNTNLNSGKFGKIVELLDGSIFMCSLDDNGLYKLDATSTPNNLQFVKTNIIIGSFTDILKGIDGLSFYTVCSSRSYTIDTDAGNCVLENLFFIYKNGILSEYSLYLTRMGMDDIYDRVEEESVAADICNGVDYRMDYDPIEERYYIFNLTSGKMFISTDNIFGKFIGSFTTTIEGVIIDYKDKIITVEDSGVVKLLKLSSSILLDPIKNIESKLYNGKTIVIKNYQLSRDNIHTAFNISMVDINNIIDLTGPDISILNGNQVAYDNSLIKVTFVNNFYYILDVAIGMIYKLNKDFNIVGNIKADSAITLFTTDNALFIQDATGSIWTDKETVKRHPSLFEIPSATNTKIIAKVI